MQKNAEFFTGKILGKFSNVSNRTIPAGGGMKLEEFEKDEKGDWPFREVVGSE